MSIDELVDEYVATRQPGWLVLSSPETLACCIDAVRYYAAYGNVNSLSLADKLPGAGQSPGAPAQACPVIKPSLPVKRLDLLDKDTELTVGEWAVVRPLFALYVERENAMRLEASRAAGLEVYGRAVSEIAQDITLMESETLPAKAFSHAIIEV